MAFHACETVRGHQKDSRASISYRKPNTKNGRGKLPRLNIAIPKAVVNGTKLKENQKFGIFIGDGKDAGKARIQPTAEGAAVRLLKGGAAFSFGYVPMLGEDQAEKEFVDVKAIDGGFEITLPAWFKG